eukprot:COSAG06_NODE_35636_length_457_cov_1.418994_1_plen_89_part_01
MWIWPVALGARSGSRQHHSQAGTGRAAAAAPQAGTGWRAAAAAPQADGAHRAAAPGSGAAASDCADCIAGRYASVAGSTVCSECTQGKY